MPQPRNLAIVGIVVLSSVLLGVVLGISLRGPVPDCPPCPAAPSQAEIEKAAADPAVPVSPLVEDAARPREVVAP
jgi:hypothetical protein